MPWWGPIVNEEAAVFGVRLRWPEDTDRKEPESFSWHVLQKADWQPKLRKDAHMAWRYSEAHLLKRGSDAAPAQKCARATQHRP